MNWMEQAALITAMRHSRTEMRVTSIDDIHFLAPVRVGDR
jgi:acyl-CoA hydrolase